MRRALVGLVALLFLIMATRAAPPVAAQQNSIRPGGSYTVTAQVYKSAGVRLVEGEWEVRAYFYSGTNCFNTGSWWQSGSEWIYSGWYDHRYSGDSWTGESGDKTFNITTQVVNSPRPQEDKNHGMTDIPIGSSVTLRARLLIKDINAKFTGEDAGNVVFTIGGVQYQYPFQKDQWGDIWISGEGFQARIDQDYQGVYRLLIDQSTPVSVSNDAPSSGTIIVPSINLNLTLMSPPEPGHELPFELKVIIAVVVVMAVVGAVVYLALRGRGAEEMGPL